MMVHATETKTVSEKTRKVDSDITQTITGPVSVPASSARSFI